MSDSLRPHESQHARPPLSIPEFTQTHVHRVGDAIQPSHPVIPFSSCPQSLPTSESFPKSQLCMRWLKYWSFSFSIIPSNEHPGLQNGLTESLCCPRDAQESSPTPQFKSINSLALSFLHSPTLTFIHDHWKTQKP